MFIISQQKIEIDCPACGTKNLVTLKQIENQETIKCSGCEKNINLVDKDGSMKKSISDINKEIKNLENTIKKLRK